MSQSKSVRVVTLFLVVAGSAASGNEPIEVKGVIDAVTVYRGQAYVTRVVELPGPAGLREVVVTGLPDRILSESLSAESADGVEVRSVRYRVRPVHEDVRDEVRTLDQQLAELQDNWDANQRRIALLAEQRVFLNTLEQFSAPTANLELHKGVLNADTIKSLTHFIFDERTRLAEDELRLNKQKKELEQRRELLQRERAVLTGSSARTVREAVVFVNLVGDGGQLRVRYLVDNAGWTPSYTVRADEDRSEAVLDYLASIHQMSGEEWSNVQMTLSTATPSLVSRAPTLSPLHVTLTSGTAVGIRESRDALRGRKGEVAVQRAARAPARLQQQQMSRAFDDRELDESLNRLAAAIQVLDLTERERITRSRALRSPAAKEGVSVTYVIPSRTTLPSRSDRQLVQITSRSMPADFHRIGVPVLTEYVYEEALVINDSNLVLLEGPIASYLGGRFVGEGELPLVAAGEHFTVGFGIDPALRTRRELIEKLDTIQGGNRVTSFTYRLSIENFGDKAASLRLLDRLPHPKQTDVILELRQTGQPISDDSDYLRTDRPNGILRWDVDVPAEAFGSRAFDLEYQFVVEYDRQMTLASALASGS